MKKNAYFKFKLEHIWENRLWLFPTDKIQWIMNLNIFYHLDEDRSDLIET